MKIYYPYLKDENFLKKIDKQILKKKFVKIILLNWEEEPIQEIQGFTTGGTINLDAKSSIRRTGSLSIILDETKTKITEVSNLFSINKKIFLEVGYSNTTNQYTDYDIIWFPMGTFVMSSCNISHTSQGSILSAQLKDKMCLLSGDCGGTLPAAIQFDKYETITEDGKYIIDKPTIENIIRELVNHYGGEQLGKIIISDIPERIKQVMRWTGQYSLYLYFKPYEQSVENTGIYTFTLNKSIAERDGKISCKNELANYTKIYDEETIELMKDAIDNDTIDDIEDIEIKTFLKKLYKQSYREYLSGADIGYIYTYFTYPDDLICKAGDSITSVLDKIIQTLGGNFEYYYDIEGNFIFQEIRNYLNTTQTTVELKELKNEDYIIDITKGKNIYNFEDSSLVVSYSNNPQYTNIKNDYVVWGVKKSDDGINLPIRYHLAIDKKPETGNIYEDLIVYKDENDGLQKASKPILKANLDDKGIEGFFYYLINDANKIIYKWENNRYQVTNYKMINIKTTDWRTELYLQGISAEVNGLEQNYYYAELKNEWPKIYNLIQKYNEEEDCYEGDFYDFVLEAPSNLEFFLDFIDSSAAIGEFSIDNIGRRTKVKEDDKINCVIEPDIPDLVIIEDNTDNTDELKKEAQKQGQNYILVDNAFYSLLSTGGILNGCYTEIKSMLWTYTNYNETVQLQTIPIYYLEPNTRIGIVDPDSDIYGDYIITSMSIPLTYGSVMSISASRAISKI